MSIIIPVYNAETYISNCLDSILNQTYEKIELIIIDDGSTDNTKVLCENYIKKDNRIRMIFQENSGPSVARNKGIEAAKGEYIQFVDSDDIIMPDMTKKLIDLLNVNLGTDLVVCGYKSKYKVKGKLVEKDVIPNLNGRYSIGKFVNHFGELLEKSLINSPCNKLYSSKIIKAKGLQFIMNVNNGEDLLFNLEYLNACQSVSVLNESLYVYLHYNNENSLTQNFKGNFYDNRKLILENIKGFLIENNNYLDYNREVFEVYYTKYIINSFENLFHKNGNLSKYSRKEMIKQILSDDWFIKNFKMFKDNTIQYRFIKFCINSKILFIIYYLFKLRLHLKDILKR